MKRPLLCTIDSLMQEWCWEENEQRGLNPKYLSVGSGKKAIWRCSNGHRYEATINHRDLGYGCPYCCGRKVLAGYNDFASHYPELASEWSSQNPLLPSQITIHSGKRYLWKCKSGHEWSSTTSDRISGHGCPYCSGRKAIRGVNDLNTLRPDLAAEWDYDNNLDVAITSIKPGSKKVVSWKCQNGHSWKATVKNRTNGSGCPFCSGHFPISGENDLLTVNPTLANEWHKKLNSPLMPEMVLPHSNRIVWWLGICGHEWQDSINHRTAGRGCPICNKRNHTSFPEQAIYYYIRQQYPDTINGYREIFDDAMEIDVYIPCERIGIEYDGIAWHNDENAYMREYRKYQKCRDEGITLIRVKEHSDNNTDSNACDMLYVVDTTLDKAIESLLHHLSITCDVNTRRDRRLIQEQYLSAFSQNSLEVSFPQLVKEWHPTKNGALRPSMFSAGSGSRIWWLCARGHEWEEAISGRTSDGTGCPYCSNHRLLPGYNDLATVAPHIASEWNYEKNHDNTPETILSCATKKVWWICKKQHEWPSSVRERVRRNQSCPYCCGKRAWPGFNDFATTHPFLLQEWHTEKNYPASPEMFTHGSSKRLWWICRLCRHEWQTSIANRTSGSGCPKCANRRRVANLKQYVQKQQD